MNIVSLPSKTFLIGEYAVLNKGCGIVINTSPRFKFENKKFFDPHKQKGGFGASSAKWIFSKDLKNVDPLSTIFDFVKDSWNGEGIKPSGVDVLSQLFGGVFLIDLSSMNYKILDWKFYDFFILRSEVKIETRKHLKKLTDLNKFKRLTEISVKAHEAFLNSNKVFFEHLKEFDLELTKQNLCFTKTQDTIKKIRSFDEVLYARGCGALCADTIIVFLKPNKAEVALKKIQDLNLEIVATQDDITGGIKHEI